VETPAIPRARIFTLKFCKTVRQSIHMAAEECLGYGLPASEAAVN
jgi:hypothetical protein